MKVKYTLMALLFCGIALAPVSAQVLGKVGDEKHCLPAMPVDIGEYGSAWTTDDRNGDGMVDHVAQFDKNGRTSAEAFDFNFDGKMDDFYTFSGGAVTQEELDTNYDGFIDLWVQVYQGVYVASYERDSNFDGKLDIVKQYGKDQIVKR